MIRFLKTRKVTRPNTSFIITYFLCISCGFVTTNKLNKSRLQKWVKSCFTLALVR